MRSVTTAGLDAYYGSFRAIADVGMAIPAGKITALIGPSGCGKSTFLRCLNRMHEMVPGARVEGSVMLDAIDAYASGVSASEVRRVVGMVFQRPNPFPTLSVFENVAAGLRLDGTFSGSEIDARVEASLKGAHLWDEVSDRLDISASSLSGGQQQRLCIARTIAVQPDVILMDEPCSALDPIATLRIESLMRDLANDYTIVIVTHNMQQAGRVADFTGFFSLEVAGEPGRLIEFDDTGKIFSNPDDERTEAYISGRFG